MNRMTNAGRAAWELAKDRNQSNASLRDENPFPQSHMPPPPPSPLCPAGWAHGGGFGSQASGLVVSTCLALTVKHASPSSASHYHVCPGREKQRSKTALGNPNREYLKYQRKGKRGPGHLFNLPPLRREQEEFSEPSGQKGQGSREVQGGVREARCCWQEAGLKRW